MELRLSELYTSIQGEGPNVGQATQFVRFAGCNLRCPGWPCDTPFAIHPQIWRHEATRLTGLELADRLSSWPRSLTLTGGEPFLQSDFELARFMEVVLGTYEVDIFTNGTLPFPRWAKDCSLILDWKLSGSGESLNGKQIQARRNNLELLTATSAIKFTVASEADLREAEMSWKVLKEYAPAHFFVGAVWGKITDKEIVDFVLKHELPWKLNVQVHKHIWPEAERGV